MSVRRDCWMRVSSVGGEDSVESVGEDVGGERSMVVRAVGVFEARGVLCEPVSELIERRSDIDLVGAFGSS